MGRKSIFSSLLVILFSYMAQAGAGAPPPPVFVSATNMAIDIKSVLQAPPITSDFENQQELSLMKLLISKRTDADCARAGVVATKYNLDNMFGPSVGMLSADQVAALNPLFDQIRVDVTYVGYQAKNTFEIRQRPFVEDASITVCSNMKAEPSPSYPSGHTITAWVYAEVLSDLDSAHAEQYRARAAQIANDRVLAGMHHPSDILAGVKVAKSLYSELKSTAAFQTAEEKAKSVFSNK